MTRKMKAKQRRSQERVPPKAQRRRQVLEPLRLQKKGVENARGRLFHCRQSLKQGCRK